MSAKKPNEELETSEEGAQCGSLQEGRNGPLVATPAARKGHEQLTSKRDSPYFPLVTLRLPVLFPGNSWQ